MSSVLAPISFLSDYDPCVFPPAPWLAKLYPLGIAPVLNKLGKRAVREWGNPVRKLRSEIGLEPGGDPIFEGQHSPALVLAMFSELLGKPQPDIVLQPQQHVAVGHRIEMLGPQIGLGPQHALQQGAHLGGIAAGLMLAPLFSKPGILVLAPTPATDEGDEHGQGRKVSTVAALGLAGLLVAGLAGWGAITPSGSGRLGAFLGSFPISKTARRPSSAAAAALCE